MDTFIVLFTLFPSISLIALWKHNQEFIKSYERERVSAQAMAAVAAEAQIRLVERERVIAA